MFNWLFKKKADEFQSTVKNSFANIKQDMSQISNWIAHFKDHHDSHEDQFSKLTKRLEEIEKKLDHLHNEPSSSQNVVEQEIDQDSFVEREFNKWGDLTPLQQKIALQIYALQKENDGKWLSLKQVAQEIYPNKEYSKIRSTVSDYIGILEEFDYLERKRKGRQAFVRFKGKKIPQTTFASNSA